MPIFEHQRQWSSNSNQDTIDTMSSDNQANQAQIQFWKEDVYRLVEQRQIKDQIIKKLQEENVSLLQESLKIFRQNKLLKREDEGKKKNEQEKYQKILSYIQQFEKKIQTKDNEINLIKAQLWKYKDEKEEYMIFKRRCDQLKRETIEKENEIKQIQTLMSKQRKYSINETTKNCELKNQILTKTCQIQKLQKQNKSHIETIYMLKGECQELQLKFNASNKRANNLQKEMKKQIQTNNQKSQVSIWQTRSKSQTSFVFKIKSGIQKLKKEDKQILQFNKSKNLFPRQRNSLKIMQQKKE